MPAPTYESICTDLHDAIERTIKDWELRNAPFLAVLGPTRTESIIILALDDFIPEPDEDIDDNDNEPLEPIGEEAFENSYIGGGGSPDLDNL